MTIHTTDTDPITLINVFEVDPDQLEAFLAGWRERAELMSARPGFRSLRLHRALTREARFQVVNVAQWDNSDALQAAMLQQDWRGKVASAVDQLGFTANPGIYRVAFEIRDLIPS
jgi:heme oxygenase (mycobilin-producing)